MTVPTNERRREIRERFQKAKDWNATNELALGMQRPEHIQQTEADMGDLLDGLDAADELARAAAVIIELLRKDIEYEPYFEDRIDRLRTALAAYPADPLRETEGGGGC